MAPLTKLVLLALASGTSAFSLLSIPPAQRFVRAMVESLEESWALAPSPFALTQSFRAEDFELLRKSPQDLLADEQELRLQLPQLADAKVLVADAVELGLRVQVIYEQTQVGTNIIVAGGRRALVEYIGLIRTLQPCVGPCVVTWTTDGTAAIAPRP